MASHHHMTCKSEMPTRDEHVHLHIADRERGKGVERGNTLCEQTRNGVVVHGGEKETDKGRENAAQLLTPDVRA